MSVMFLTLLQDAVDVATRESAPAEDAGDANSLEKEYMDDLVQTAEDVFGTNATQSKASVPSEAPAAPPPSPST